MVDKDTIKKISEHIEILREQATRKGLAFSSPTTEQLERKLKSTHTPFIVSQNWTPNGPAGGTFLYQLAVYNPDPDSYQNLYVYFFFGPANMVQDVGMALLSVDETLYRGFVEFPPVSSGSYTYITLNYTFPNSVPVGLYTGNSFVFMWEPLDVGKYIERGSIHVQIT